MNKMSYPRGRMLLVRDCTVAICNNNNPASVLLSTFLFWYDNPHKGDTYQEDTFTMCRTQSEIAQASCGQIDVKTIHDTAVPFLQLFGYLTVKEKMNGNLYILHVSHINAAYVAYEQGPLAVKAFLKFSLQLESAPIRIPDNEIELTLINKRWLYLQIERALIANRAGTNCRRGPKPRSEAVLEVLSEKEENLRESREITLRERNREEDSLRRYDEGYTGKKRISTFNDTPSHIHTPSTSVDNSSHDASSAILETGAPNALPVVTQQPAHPEEPMRASNGSTSPSLPIATPTTSPASSFSSEDMPLPCSNGHSVEPAMATPGFSYPMATGNASETQPNGSSVSSTPTPVGDIPSQPASPRTDASDRIPSDAAVTTSNTDECRDEVQESATSEVIQESFTELSTTKTEKKGKSKKIPPPAEKSTPTPEEKAREEAFQARCRGIYAQIVEWRGYALEDKGPLITERKYVRKLAEKFTDKQIASIRHHLFTKDFKWSKPSYRYKIGAYEIYYEAEPTLQLFKEEEKAKSNGHGSPETNTLGGLRYL